MTKAEIIAEVTANTGVDKQEVLKIVEKLFDVVKKNMIEGKNVYVRGFGSFINKKRAKKVARNLSKNIAMIIPEHYVPSFKPSKTFLDKVKKNVNDGNVLKTTVKASKVKTAEKVAKPETKTVAKPATKTVAKATDKTVTKPAAKTTKK